MLGSGPCYSYIKRSGDKEPKNSRDYLTYFICRDTTYSIWGECIIRFIRKQLSYCLNGESDSKFLIDICDYRTGNLVTVSLRE